jgi:uncharacterized iron-regulated membrane protein
MNDPRDPDPESTDDSLLEELLAPLRQLEPSIDARLRNRMAVAAQLELAASANRRRHASWWRRSISVPVPVAVAAALILGVVLLLSHRPGKQEPAVAPAHRPAQAAPIAEYHMARTYLPGIGWLQTESGYSFQE